MLTLALAVLTVAGFGCAQDVGDIDRTQPDKIKKAIFEDNDEWYYTQTVTDTDYQGSFIFAALETPLKRIRWEITEDFLFAYSTVDPVEGLHDDQKADEDKKLGAVAAFPIVDHFDVQRSYNPNTGEPTNVIVENRSDKPWYDRQYMRVDWSTNLVDGQGMFGSNFGAFSAAAWNPPQESDHVHPDRTKISEDYIDVTVQYTFQPDINSCFASLGYDAISYCEGGKVRARNSFLRIDEEMQKEKYEPLVYNNTNYLEDDNGERLMTRSIQDPSTRYYMEVECNDETNKFLKNEYGATDERCSPATFDYFQRFGYFRTRRIGFDKKRPQVDSQRRYYANRWDIWTEIDGEKKPKPIVYHLNAGYPKDMIPAAKEVERQWNNAFKEAVMLGGDYDSIEAVTQDLQDTHGDPRMFKILRNSCHPGPLMKWKTQYGAAQDKDRRDVSALFDEALSGIEGASAEEKLWNMPVESREQLCADVEWATEMRAEEDARFEWEQRGDLRYSFFNWVREYNGYWSGYGPSSADPKTGQIISADANFSGTPLRRTATYAADIIQYMNGELSQQDVQYGKHIRDYIQNQKQRQKKQALKPGEELMPAAAQRELARRAGQKPSEVSPTNFEDAPDFSEQPDILQLEGKKGFDEEAARLAIANERAQQSDTTLEEFYSKPKVKSLLMKDQRFQMMVDALAAENYGVDADKHARHQAYLDLTVPKRHLNRHQQSRRWMAENNIFAADNLQRAVEGLVTYRGMAEYFKGMDRSKIERYFMDKAFIGTQLHEVGHTIGLRHNFSASMDALNYHDAFWNIQKAVLSNENVSNEDRYKLTGKLAEEVTGRKGIEYANEEEFQQASVMDYTSDLTGRFAGLGKYDQAAINFAYAGHVEVWDKDFEIDSLLWYEQWTGDYTELPEIYGSSTDASGEKAKKLAGIDVITKRREWIPVEQALAEKRQGIQSNTQKWQSGKLSTKNGPFVDRTVAYNFCSDYRRGRVLGCDVFDHGANHTEVVNHSFNTYRFFQPFWRYKGESIDNNYQTFSRYISRVMSTLETAETPFRYHSYYRWFDLGAYTDDLERASIDALNFYAEVLAMPEPGRYCEYDEDTVPVDDNWYYSLKNSYVPADWHNDRGGCANYIDIPRGTGQFYGFDYTADWGPTEQSRIRRIGTFIDKSLATQSFFSISANFVNSSFFTDARATNISYWTLFREEMLNWMGSVILGDFTGYSGAYDQTSGEYLPPKVVDPETFGTGQTPQDLRQNMTRVRTRSSFNHEFNTLVGALFQNSSWYDRSVDFSQYIKIVKDKVDEQTWADGTEVVEFSHPITNVVYKAPQTTDDKSISVKLIKWAQGLKGEWEDAKCISDNFQPKADVAATEAALKQACDLNSIPVRITVGDADAERDTLTRIHDFRDRRVRQLEDVVAKLNMVRDVNQLVDLER